MHSLAPFGRRRAETDTTEYALSQKQDAVPWVRQISHQDANSDLVSVPGSVPLTAKGQPPTPCLENSVQRWLWWQLCKCVINELILLYISVRHTQHVFLERNRKAAGSTQLLYRMCQSFCRVMFVVCGGFFPGTFPSWTTFTSSSWLQPRYNTVGLDVLLPIFSCFGNSFKQPCHRHGQNNSLFSSSSGTCVPKSEFHDQSPRLDSPPILVTHSNKFTTRKQRSRFRIWFLAVNKRRNWSLVNILCHLLYHIKDQHPYCGLYKLGFNIYSLSELTFNCMERFRFISTTGKLAATGVFFCFYEVHSKLVALKRIAERALTSDSI